MIWCSVHYTGKIWVFCYFNFREVHLIHIIFLILLYIPCNNCISPIYTKGQNSWGHTSDPCEPNQNPGGISSRHHQHIRGLSSQRLLRFLAGKLSRFSPLMIHWYWLTDFSSRLKCFPHSIRISMVITFVVGLENFRGHGGRGWDWGRRRREWGRRDKEWRGGRENGR